MSVQARTACSTRPVAALMFAPVPSSLLQHKYACGGTPGVDGACAECRIKRLQRKAMHQHGAAVPPSIVHEVLQSAGQPLDPSEIVELHGIASEEGDPGFNLNLSCTRALRAKAVAEEVLAQRGVSATIRVFNHGAVAGDAVQHRSVVMTRTVLPPPQPVQTCGPDVTGWFIRQVDAAKRDATIVAMQQRLTGAEREARHYGFSAEQIAEGAVARRVLNEDASVGTPPRTSEAAAQLAALVLICLTR